MTTTATKRMRVAALGLSTALSVGALAPFIGTSSASAADCSTYNSSYQTANGHVAKDTKKVKHFKKKLKKDKKHHKAKSVIKKDKKKVKKWKKQRTRDLAARNTYYSQYTQCNTSNTTPGGTTALPSPLDLSSLIGALQGGGLDPSALTDALNALAAQVSSQGADVPGSQAFADGLKALANAIQNNSSSLSPAELQTLLSELPQGADPAAFQAALQAAVTGLTDAASNPPTTASGVIDDIIDPIQAGLAPYTAADPLNNLLGDTQSGLDTVLGDLGLSGLGGLTGSSPLSASDASALLSNLSSLSPTGASSALGSLDPSTLTNVLSSLAAQDPTGLSTELTSLASAGQLQNALGGLDASQLQQVGAADPTGVISTLLNTLLGLGS